MKDDVFRTKNFYCITLSKQNPCKFIIGKIKTKNRQKNESASFFLRLFKMLRMKPKIMYMAVFKNTEKRFKLHLWKLNRL